MQHIDAGHLESQCLCGLDGHCAFAGFQFNRNSATAAVQVAAELAFAALALVGGYDLTTNYDGANVGSFGFFDEFLHQNIGIQRIKGFDDASGGCFGFREHHAFALGAL